MNITTAISTIRGMGLTCTHHDGEFRVNHKGGKVETAYFTTDADDAIATATDMACRTGTSAAAYVRYLREVGADQRESGRECTADDYTSAANLIDEQRVALNAARAALVDATAMLQHISKGGSYNAVEYIERLIKLEQAIASTVQS